MTRASRPPLGADAVFKERSYGWVEVLGALLVVGVPLAGYLYGRSLKKKKAKKIAGTPKSIKKLAKELAAKYSASASSIAARTPAGGLSLVNSSEASLSASALPHQSTRDSNGGAGASRCAGTHRAVNSPRHFFLHRTSQRSECLLRNGLSPGWSLPMP